jgi:L-iditol 2-dehydrogenase
VPETMAAAVYRGAGRIVFEQVDTPVIGPGELLIQVQSCGVCHTDLKKIEYNLLPPPRIYGHETAGIVVGVGSGVTKFSPGDRVVAFHHVPCRDCFYCRRRLYAQCTVYKRVGITSGFEPAGGGFAQYVRVMDWIVEKGVERIPRGVSFDQACWVEPVNTCLKAVELLNLEPDDVVAILGQGPIGLIFTLLVKRTGAQVVTSDTIAFRRELSEELGASAALGPSGEHLDQVLKAATHGRGADAVILATSAPGLLDQALRISRPGAKILLFAQTNSRERMELSGASICVGERTILGSYSADIDVQAESARLVFEELPLERLISHRVPLNEIERGFAIASRPDERSLKVVVHPQEQS